MTNQSLEDNFRSLAKQWHAETGHLSSISQKSEHSAYQSIIQMGEQAIPLIFNELNEHGGHWFIALRVILKDIGIEPPQIPPDASGKCGLLDKFG